MLRLKKYYLFINFSNHLFFLHNLIKTFFCCKAIQKYFNSQFHKASAVQNNSSDSEDCPESSDDETPTDQDETSDSDRYLENSYDELLSNQDKLSDSKNSNKKFTGELPPEAEILQQLEHGKNPYLEFVEEAKNRAQKLFQEKPDMYYENHHIIPRFEGGSDEPSNLIKLTYNDHVIAHYIRWIVYGKKGDQIAYSVMSGQDVDVRRARASIGGRAGGPKGQQTQREQKVGWYDPEGQSERGKKGAEKNRQQGTGAFDPENLKKANQVLKENPGLYADQKRENLRKGRETQKAKKINLGDPVLQRLKSLKKSYLVKINGIEYTFDPEQRTCICETTLWYYLMYAPKKRG